MKSRPRRSTRWSGKRIAFRKPGSAAAPSCACAGETAYSKGATGREEPRQRLRMLLHHDALPRTALSVGLSANSQQVSPAVADASCCGRSLRCRCQSSACGGATGRPSAYQGQSRTCCVQGMCVVDVHRAASGLTASIALTMHADACPALTPSPRPTAPATHDVSPTPLHRRPDGLKKAYVRLTTDYDALDVANKIGII